MKVRKMLSKVKINESINNCLYTLYTFVLCFSTILYLMSYTMTIISKKIGML